MTINTLKSTFLLLIVMLVAAYPIHAQENEDKPVREIGIGSSNLSSNFSFIYKKELEENKYKRYDAFFSMVYLDRRSTSNSYLLSTLVTDISFTLGTENRKYINDKFKFVHGFYYGGGIKMYFQEGNTVVELIPEFGYLLGVQYDINDQFYIGATTFPGIITDISLNSEDVHISKVMVGFTTIAELSLLYRF
ncbi:hypothetical protein OKW21_000348 [Catalinimonas alkaloidigena]|uniref:hypothetical protein n=1 Tax=Catalinimonas alkaloidigena TaxID=1075417 RepID=UPI0024076BCC|nr:hypothetical protein [Catalinimonas alkaloidigena]MDF9795085.1 hypothetical protein [Catalinimonas alkaloidigena]